MVRDWRLRPACTNLREEEVTSSQPQTTLTIIRHDIFAGQIADKFVPMSEADKKFLGVDKEKINRLEDL